MARKGVSNKAIKELEKHRKVQQEAEAEPKIETVRRQLAFDHIEGVPDDGKPYLLRWGNSHVLVKIMPLMRRKKVLYMDGTEQTWKNESDIAMSGSRRRIDESLSLSDGKWSDEE